MSVARHQGFVTRAQCGLAPPTRPLSSNITPGNGGTVWHWVGTRVSISAHSQCAGVWRNIQRHHQRTNGWVDVAYTMGICPHGFVYAGRGAGARTAANGTNDGNQNNYAICGFIGSGQRPTRQMIEAMLWATRTLRTTGGAGMRVRPHGDFTGSTCPGPDLRSESRKWDRKDIPTSGDQVRPEPTPPSDNRTDFEKWWDSMDKNKQQVLEALADIILERGPEGQPEGRTVTPATLGRSFGLNSYIMLREDRQWIRELSRLVGLKTQGGHLNTSLQGAITIGLNAGLYLRDDQGVNLPHTKRFGT